MSATFDKNGLTPRMNTICDFAGETDEGMTMANATKLAVKDFINYGTPQQKEHMIKVMRIIEFFEYDTKIAEEKLDLAHLESYNVFLGTMMTMDSIKHDQATAEAKMNQLGKLVSQEHAMHFIPVNRTFVKRMENAESKHDMNIDKLRTPDPDCWPEGYSCKAMKEVMDKLPEAINKLPMTEGLKDIGLGVQKSIFKKESKSKRKAHSYTTAPTAKAAMKTLHKELTKVETRLREEHADKAFNASWEANKQVSITEGAMQDAPKEKDMVAEYLKDHADKSGNDYDYNEKERWEYWTQEEPSIAGKAFKTSLLDYYAKLSKRLEE